MTIGTDPQDLERSIRRGKHRERVFLCITNAGSITIREIADATGIPPKRVEGLLFGDGEEFSHDLSLIALGVVERDPEAYAEGVRPTVRGLDVAPRVRARRRLPTAPQAGT